MNLTVVVAEDDELIRMLAVEALTEAGFAVLEAECAEIALDHLHSNAAEVRLLFTDIQMPGDMNGLDLAQHTHVHWPWIAVLVASGLSEPKTHEMPRGSRFLPKPYHPDAMVTHAKELLGAA